MGNEECQHCWQEVDRWFTSIWLSGESQTQLQENIWTNDLSSYRSLVAQIDHLNSWNSGQQANRAIDWSLTRHQTKIKTRRAELTTFTTTLDLMLWCLDAWLYPGVPCSVSQSDRRTDAQSSFYMLPSAHFSVTWFSWTIWPLRKTTFGPHPFSFLHFVCNYAIFPRSI